MNVTTDQIIERLQLAVTYAEDGARETAIARTISLLDDLGQLPTGVYLVHREEEDEPLWAFENEGAADIVVMLLKRQGTKAWTSFQPIAYTLNDDAIRETLGHVLGGEHWGLLTAAGAVTEKLNELVDAAVKFDADSDADAATVLDAFFGEDEDE